MTHAEFVDNGIDLMLAANPGLDEFVARDLAGFLGVTRRRTSDLLQAHRRAQGKGNTRYIVNARSYARAAKWYIVSSSRSTRTGQRLTLGHAAHIARDLQRRAESDLANELSSAAMRHPAIQVLMKGMEAQIDAAITGLVNGVNVSLTLIEQTTGLVADRRSVR